MRQCTNGTHEQQQLELIETIHHRDVADTKAVRPWTMARSLA